MPRPPRPWFRFYSEAIDSEKLDDLPDRLVKPWILLLCLANISKPRGTLPHIRRVRHILRVSESKAHAILKDLVRYGFVDEKDGVFVMHDWDDFQYESDANLTPGRKKRHGKEDDDGNADGTPLERAIPANGTPLERIEAEAEEETETETEAEAEAEPPAHPFAFLFARKHQERNAMRPPPSKDHAAALALEREFGADACIQIAEDYDWQKHPNYYRPILQERREQRDQPRPQ